MLDPSAIDAALRTGHDAELARVEEAGLNAAQPREQLLIDGWLLRFSPGKARRSRSVNAITAGAMALDDKLSLCRRWYRRFGLPLIIRVTPLSRPAGLDEHLAAAGFVAYDETRVMTCRLSDAPADRDGLAARAVDCRDFAEAVGSLRESPPRQVEAHWRRLRDCPLQSTTVRLVAYRADATPLAAGQVIVQDDLAGLYDIVTAVGARGHGVGRAVSRRLLAAAATLGARSAYLQVDAGNEPARRIYSSLGFVDRYAYWYRRPADVVDRIPD